jgi:hypothetical protein
MIVLKAYMTQEFKQLKWKKFIFVSIISEVMAAVNIKTAVL